MDGCMDFPRGALFGVIQTLSIYCTYFYIFYIHSYVHPLCFLSKSPSVSDAKVSILCSSESSCITRPPNERAAAVVVIVCLILMQPLRNLLFYAM